MSNGKYYLKKGRLSDVIALIQVLAFDKEAHRRELELFGELQGIPDSAKSWSELAMEHRELFRVNREKQITGGPAISLVARHVTEKDENNIRQLPDITKKLIETAIELHDRQKERADFWKVWIPVIAVLVTGLINILVTLTAVKSGKDNVSTFEKNIPADYLQIEVPDNINKVPYQVNIIRNYKQPAFLSFANCGNGTYAKIYDSTYLNKLSQKIEIKPLKLINSSNNNYPILDISDLKRGTYFIEYSSCNVTGTVILKIE